MSEFEGGKVKVRCVDCTRLVGTKCGVKRAKVSVKKRRTCNKYNFKGEYENRDPLDATYMPHMDSNTRRMLKKLMKLGVMPNTGNSPIPPPPSPGEFAEPYVAPESSAFQTTATAQIPVVAPLESVGEEARELTRGGAPEGESVIWTPEEEDETGEQ